MLLAWAFANMDKIGIAIVATDRPFLENFGLVGNRAAIGLLFTGFTFAYAAGNFVWGFAIDRVGARKVTIISAVLWAAMMIAAPVAASYGVLLASRLLLGVAEGCLWAVSAKLVGNWFHVDERARAMGFTGYGQVVGPALAAPLIVALIYAGGWRLSFYALGLLDILIIVPIFWFLVRDTPEEHGALTPAELGYIKDGRRISRQPEAPSAQEWRATLRTPRFWLVTLAYAIGPFAFFALTTWVPSYLVEVRHFSKGAMGAWISAGYLIAIGELLIATFLADYLRWPGLIGGIALAVAGVNLWIGIHSASPNLAAILITTGQGGCLVATMMSITLLQRYFEPRVLGRVAGTTAAVGSVVGGLSPTILGWMLDVGKGDYTPSLVFLATVLFVGAFIFVAALGVRTKVEDLQVVGV